MKTRSRQASLTRVFAPTLLLFCVAVTAGCTLETASDSKSERSFDSFLAEAERLPDGRLIIDSDILVSNEQEALEYFNQEMTQTRRHLDTREEIGARSLPLTLAQDNGQDSFWEFPQGLNLRYCVNTSGFGSNATPLRDALKEASYLWSRRVGVSFQEINASVCNSATSEVEFNVRHVSAGFNAAAFFPYTPRSNRELLVTDSAFTTTSGGRDLVGILTHELGHALGFRHEHIWLSPACTAETTADARLLTPYDVDSVMHYPQCRPSGDGGYRPSELDYKGALEIYGIAPALFVTVTG